MFVLIQYKGIVLGTKVGLSCDFKFKSNNLSLRPISRIQQLGLSYDFIIWMKELTIEVGLLPPFSNKLF